MADSIKSVLTHRLTKYGATALFLLVLAASFLSINNNPEQSQAQTGTQCPASYAIGINGGTTAGVTTGLATVGLSALPPSGDTTLKVQRVIFKIDSNILGRATINGTSQSYWTMDWISQVTDNGPHEIRAEVLHTNGFYCSTINPKFTDVQNSTKFSIPAQSINPASWVGPTNLPADFEIAPFGAPDVRRFMQVEWSTNKGAISASSPNYIGRFFSGTSGGDGTVKARVYYGGQVKDLEVPVSVTAFNTEYDPVTDTTNNISNGTISDPDVTTTVNSDGSTTITNSDGSTTTIKSDGSTTTSNTGQTSKSGSTLTSQLLNSDGTVRQCLLNSIGEDRLKLIEDEKSRPTATEFEKYRSCFAKQSFVVAQSLAPVAPDAVRELPKTKKVAIKKAETISEDIEGVQVNKIVFSGTANPNATVLIYVFSEPLVLTTAANDSGEWTYTLEDPLEPGNHEAYSLVDTGNGDYERSDVLSLVIAKAEATEANPEGYSLQLVGTATATVDNRSQNLFIAGAVSLVAFAVVGLTLILNTRSKHKQSLQAITELTAQQPNTEEGYNSLSQSTPNISEDKRAESEAQQVLNTPEVPQAEVNVQENQTPKNE